MLFWHEIFEISARKFGAVKVNWQSLSWHRISCGIQCKQVGIWTQREFGYHTGAAADIDVT
uniref:Uncharacterized protein n=1 Tax=Mesocestoides corti TaxID=53468 RepID=A0A5K3ESJ5_MESCO